MPKKLLSIKEIEPNVCIFTIFSSFLVASCLTVLRSAVLANFVFFNLSSNIVPDNLLKSSVVIYLS